MKTIGIIGGMGPEATLDLFRKIVENTDAKCDQDHPHILIDNYPCIPDRTAYLLGKGISPAPFLIESAKRLKSAGADILCMPCNTAHYFADDIKSSVSLPLVHIVESAGRAISPATRKIGLLATKGTLIGRVYHNVLEDAGFEIIKTPEEIQNDVMEVIYSVKAGRTSEVVNLMQSCVESFEHLGAEVLIGGCTEIPLIINKVRCNVPVIDPTLELARSVIREVVPELLKA